MSFSDRGKQRIAYWEAAKIIIESNFNILRGTQRRFFTANDEFEDSQLLLKKHKYHSHIKFSDYCI